MADRHGKKKDQDNPGTFNKKSPYRVLLIEDEEAHADLIRHSFSKYSATFHLTVMTTLQEAQRKIAQEPFDLIIADWLLPDRKGIEILPADKNAIIPPVIIMTYGAEELAVELLKAGAVDYIVKSEAAFKDLPRIAERAIREWENVRERKKAEKQVKDSEARFRELFNNIGAGVAVYEAVGDGNDFIFMDINRAAEKIDNINRQDVVRRSVLEIFPGVKEFGLFDVFRRVWRTGLPEQHPVSEYKDNRITGWRDNYVYKLPSGEIVAIYEDITEEKQAKKALEDAVASWQTTFNAAGDAICLLDSDQKIIQCNQAMVRLSGRSYDELIGRHCWEIVHCTAQPISECPFVLAKNSLHRETMELRIGDGWFEVTVDPIQNAAGEFDGAVHIISDITGRKRAEENLQKTLLFLTSMIEQSPVPMWISDDKGTLIKLNKACCNLLNITEGDVVGKYNVLKDNIVEEQGFLPLVQSVFEKGQTAKFEIKYDSSQLTHLALKKTAFIILDVTIFPIKDPDGRITNAVIQHNDITNRRLAEDALKKSQIQLVEAMDLADLANWEFDVPTGIFTFDDRFYALYGTTAEREGGNKMPAEVYAREFVHPDDQNVVADEVKKAQQTTDPHYISEVEHRIIRRDGDIRHIVVRVGITKDAEGRTIKTHGVNQDVTERKKADEALRESEEKFRNLAESSPFAIMIHQGDYWVYSNPAGERISGYSKEELYVMPYWNFVAPEFRDLIKERGRKRQAHAALPASYDFRIIAKDGTVKWVTLSGGSITFRGKPAGLISVNDITERKRAENALQESEEKFRSMVDASPDMIWEIDKQGNFTYISSQSNIQLGYAPEDLIGKPIFSLIRPESVPALTTIFLAHVRDKSSFITFEVPANRRDGSLCIIEIRSVAITGYDGQLAGFRGIARDITARKQAEEALQESEERLHLTLDATNDGLWDWDIPSGKAIFSPRWYKMLGYEDGEMPANYATFARLVHPDDLGPTEAKIQNHIQQRSEGYAIELRMLTKNGDWKWILTRGKVVERSADGQPVRMVGTHTDITDRRMMEEEIRSLNKALEQRVEQRTAQLTTSLEDKEVLLREVLLREVHHRVKNNLQIIISLLNLQSRYITDENVLAAIRESQNRVKAMALVHEKLHQSADISRISLEDYVRFLGNSLFQFYGMKGKGITFTTAIPEIPLDINTAIPIGLITNELVSNSLKYAFPNGKKGEISIAILQKDHLLTIVYKDTGIGIPADLDWRNAKSLGLRLVISLVEQLQGTIELDRTAGTAFTIVVKEKE